MTMTQRYAGMLRRHAAYLDKQAMQVQAESNRQAASSVAICLPRWRVGRGVRVRPNDDGNRLAPE